MAKSKSGGLSASDHIYLIDGSTFIFRAYHALPALSRKSDGLPVGAVSGFCNMLQKLLEDTRVDDGPSHLAVIFDASSKTFRNDIYPDYKGNRDAPPEDLVPQFSIIREAVRAFNVPCIEMEGFEADDLIATYARQAESQGAQVTIVSSDKDLMQLVGSKVGMLDTMKNRTIGPVEVHEKFGVGPDKVIEVQSLAGDSVDNVPGVPGIGIKTAAELINQYGDLETLLDKAEEIKQPKRRQNLIEFADMARVSKELVTLKVDVDVETPLDEFEIIGADPQTLIGFLRAMEFTTLTKRIAAEYEVDDIEAIKPMASLAVKTKKGGTKSKKKSEEKSTGTPGATAATVDGADVPFDATAYETIVTTDDLARWISLIEEAGVVAVDTETTSLDAMTADLVGVSLSVTPGEACYIPVGHGDPEALSLGGDEDVVQLETKAVVKALKPMLEDPGILKVGQNIKYDMLILSRYGVRVAPIDDTMLLSYVIDAGLHGHGMDELSQIHLEHKPIPFSSVAGKGKAQITFNKVPIEEATAYAAEDADVTLRLYQTLKPRLASDRKTTVYETLERPLVPVLVDMEAAGIKVDRNVLSRLSGEFAQRMGSLEADVHKLAGESFNLGSPKQLGEILFGKMGLEGGKKTKTGAYATGADVLETLAAQGHDLPARLLEWRQLSKLKSTYTDALPEFIHPETGRIHTSYSMAATTTGRLSSSDPNLQNIPIRTEEGREIRTAFVADKGNVLISADYSQIELRVLAHIAGIDALKQAFADGLDIHAMTASQMFDVPIDGMDPSVRRRAKAINFGIIYGISAFGLANQLGIPRGEAQNYIKAYFERFPGIQDYMQSTKEKCREEGCVYTIFGRRMNYPRINSKNGAEKAFMERAAINAPIQGSAADIIRRAMIRMPERLKAKKLSAKMLLQVHDELVFEVPKSEADETCAVVSEAMEQAARPALDLSVPLTVEAKAAANWEQAH